MIPWVILLKLDGVKFRKKWIGKAINIACEIYSVLMFVGAVLFEPSKRMIL